MRSVTAQSAPGSHARPVAPLRSLDETATARPPPTSTHPILRSRSRVRARVDARLRQAPRRSPMEVALHEALRHNHIERGAHRLPRGSLALRPAPYMHRREPVCRYGASLRASPQHPKAVQSRTCAVGACPPSVRRRCAPCHHVALTWPCTLTARGAAPAGSYSRVASHA